MKIYKNVNNTNTGTAKQTKAEIKAHIRVNAGKWNDLSEVVIEIKKQFPDQARETDIHDYIKEIEQNKFLKSEIKDLQKADLEKVAADIPGFNNKMTKQQLIDLINPEDDK